MSKTITLVARKPFRAKNPKALGDCFDRAATEYRSAWSYPATRPRRRLLARRDEDEYFRVLSTVGRPAPEYSVVLGRRASGRDGRDDASLLTASQRASRPGRTRHPPAQIQRRTVARYESNAGPKVSRSFDSSSGMMNH